jgi:hypothetical protein
MGTPNWCHWIDFGSFTGIAIISHQRSAQAYEIGKYLCGKIAFMLIQL